MVKKKMRRATIAEIRIELEYRYQLYFNKVYKPTSAYDTSPEKKSVNRAIYNTYKVALDMLEGDPAMFWSQDNQFRGRSVRGK